MHTFKPWPRSLKIIDTKHFQISIYGELILNKCYYIAVLSEEVIHSKHMKTRYIIKTQQTYKWTGK